MKQVYIIAEQYNGKILSITNALINAALKISSDITLVCYGEINDNDLTKFSHVESLRKIIIVNVPYTLLADKIISYLSSDAVVVSGLSGSGKSVLASLSSMLNVDIFTNIMSLDDKYVTSIKYYGQIHERVEFPSGRALLTVKSTNFSRSVITSKTSCDLENISGNNLGLVPIENHGYISDKNISLQQAKTVVAGGRAFRSVSDFDKLKSFAIKINAAVGGSYAAIACGYLQKSCQIGVTGQMLRPNLYLAFGISGAVQHMAGIANDTVVVAINNNPHAEIFKTADYGVLLDWEEALDKLESSYSKGC